jgi:hypothetical protein
VGGALTERAFVENLARAGFEDVRVRERVPYGLSDLQAEPAFPDDLVALMRRLLPPRLQARVGVRLVLEARPGSVDRASRGAFSS